MLGSIPNASPWHGVWHWLMEDTTPARGALASAYAIRSAKIQATHSAGLGTEVLVVEINYSLSPRAEYRTEVPSPTQSQLRHVDSSPSPNHQQGTIVPSPGQSRPTVGQSQSQSHRSRHALAQAHIRCASPPSPPTNLRLHNTHCPVTTSPLMPPWQAAHPSAHDPLERACAELHRQRC